MAAALPKSSHHTLAPEAERELARRIGEAGKILRKNPSMGVGPALDMIGATAWGADWRSVSTELLRLEGRSIDEWRAARLVMEEAHAA